MSVNHSTAEDLVKSDSKLFNGDHALTPKNLNIESIKNHDKSASLNDSLDLTFDADMTPLTHEQVENDPNTPFYRKEFAKRRSSSNSFSPVTSISKISDESNVFLSSPSSSSFKSNNIHQSAIRNRLSSYSSGSDKQITSTPVEDKIVTKFVPNSILKKNINYDRDTSKKMVQLKPELSSALNSEGELNPLKVSKSVIISPKKEYFGGKASFKSSRFASPLTDTLNGKLKKKLKSPYTNGSPKKRSKKLDEEWEDEEEEEQQNSKKEKSRKKKKIPFWKKVIRSLVDPQLPYVLSLYLQLIFNVAIVSILLYFVYSFISTVRADVTNKVDSYTSDIMTENAICARRYMLNQCDDRVIGLEKTCAELEKCMNRDPAVIGRAKIGAETFAEIVNGFIKPISWKSMFFLLLITVGSLVLTNAAFGTYRNYTQYDQQQPSGQQSQQVPQTPHKTPYESIQYNPNYTRYYTPKASSPTNLAIVRHKQRSSKTKK